MSDLPREISGATAWDRAVNLAGFLAERGVQRVVLESGGQRREVGGRVTDLPREIVGMGEGVVEGAGVRYSVSEGAIVRE